MRKAGGWILALAAIGGVSCTGNDGKDGTAGTHGKDGVSCRVTQTDAGATVSCSDGTTASVASGATGRDGSAGLPGATGATGKDGLHGEAGASCSLQILATGNAQLVCSDGSEYVLPNAAGATDGGTCTVATTLQGQKLVRCPDGTQALLGNGADGVPGLNGNSCNVTTDPIRGVLSIKCDNGNSATLDKLAVFFAWTPPMVTEETSARFELACNWGQCTYVCSLDGAPERDCFSTSTTAVADASTAEVARFSYDNLKPGVHQLSVRAKASFSAVQTDTVAYRWTVLPIGTCARGDAGVPGSSAWAFGVMGDTQWTVADDGNNPNSVAVGIAEQVQREFVARAVKFVLQTGDLTDNGTVAALDTRAAFAQRLYNAGIGFYPLRGNHEASQAAALEVQRIFPQARDGGNNATPSDVLLLTEAGVQPPAKTGSTFTVGTGFSSPSTNLNGLSYAFQYRGATFVLLDSFTPTDGAADNGVAAQQNWIQTTLAGRADRSSTHAFVFAHKGLITENHPDTLFGDNPSQNPIAQDAFIRSLADNGAKYLIVGHDHMHDRSRITTTDGASASVMQVVCASDSSKFYTPANPSNDFVYGANGDGGTGVARQTPVAQELNTIGFYVYTVDGPRVSVDYYSSPVALDDSGLLHSTPSLTFSKRETFGYAIGGREYVIGAGQGYGAIRETFQTTTAQMLSGSNSNTTPDRSGRSFSRIINTAWSPKQCDGASDVFSIWGTGGAFDQADTFALSLTYDASSVDQEALHLGLVGVAQLDAMGNWVPAIFGNDGGAKRFVYGPWREGYPLGSFGIDPDNKTAWAVLNRGGRFAVARFSSF